MLRDPKFRPLWLCIALLVLWLWVSLLLSREDVGDFQTHGPGHIVLSEVLSSNRTYPNSQGEYFDFIEVRNVSPNATDISGYMLSDGLDSIGYTFPQGTVLPGNGYITVWCNKASETGEYASFGISKDGGETIYLYNSANVIVDSVAVPRMNTNIPLVRRNDGTWESGTQATPGFENTPAGYEAWLISMDAKDSIQVVISEIMTANSCTVLDDAGHITDWVELYNPGAATAVLDGAYLSDDPGDPFKWKIPQLTLQPGEYTLIRCVSTNAAPEEASFALPRSGCTLTLTGAMGNTIHSVTVPQIPADQSWALGISGSYMTHTRATPGYENTDTGYDAWLQAVAPEQPEVKITEVMASNYSTITNGAGKLCDWVELTNFGTVPAVLDGGYLSDDPDDRSQWQIPRLTIAPGESLVIPCSGSEAGAGEASFALKKSGCTLTLTGPAGNLLHTLQVPALDDDRSWAMDASGEFVRTDAPTPGFANSDAGREAFLKSQSPAGPLAIREGMPSNASYLPQSDGKCYDWVELQNISDSPLELSQFCLSNDPAHLDLMPLPQKTLAPGERVVIICSGNTALTGAYIQAPFTLSREESWVYVSWNGGTLSDYMRLYDVPYQGSVGRITGENGTYYFTQPTPGTENGTGVAFIAPAPQILTQEGVYNDIASLDVEIAGTGEIRYTLDGSMPTATSPLYEKPISVSRTTVIRAAAFADGKLRSDVVTGAYILNENHTLPVISITAEPASIFGGEGIYVDFWADKEVPCNLKLFEEEGSFSIDCGLKMFGHSGLVNEKKSFKVNFRSRYGTENLSYPVYGEDAPQYYDSLVIRAGQDYPMTIFRDELFTSLCREMSDQVLAQRDKFCILYINGEYFGIYCLKEAFSETMYATNRDVPEDTVEMVQAPVGIHGDMAELIRFCWGNNLADPENWEYVSSQVNIDSLIDWMIMEGYCTNSDIQQNLRYFRSSQRDNKWEFAYYDLDWAFYYDYQFVNILAPEMDKQHTALTKGFMQNQEFREKFIQRLMEVLETTLSDEHVFARIDYYTQLLDPEVPRERQRWSGSYEAWLSQVENLKNFIRNDHVEKLIRNLNQYGYLTWEEMQTYFGRWLN